MTFTVDFRISYRKQKRRFEGSIPDLHNRAASLWVGLNVDVDGEVSVDVTHLVLEATGNADHQVVNDGADGTEGSNTLAGTVVQLDGDNVLLGAAEGDGNVGEILDELAAGTLDSHDAGANLDLHYRAEKRFRLVHGHFFFFCEIQYFEESKSRIVR